MGLQEKKITLRQETNDSKNYRTQSALQKGIDGETLREDTEKELYDSIKRWGFVVKQKQDKQELQDMTNVEERHIYNDQSNWTGTTQKKNDMTEPKDGGKFAVRQKQLEWNYRR